MTMLSNERVHIDINLMLECAKMHGIFRMPQLIPRLRHHGVA